jgi:hypothetical protein
MQAITLLLQTLVYYNVDAGFCSIYAEFARKEFLLPKVDSNYGGSMTVAEVERG